MNIDLAALPNDVDTLHWMIGDLAAALDSQRTEAQAEIDRLRHIVKMLQRSRFGRRSERLDDDQMQLGLEYLDTDIARAETDLAPEVPSKEQKPGRLSDGRPSLPDHLPREDMTLDIGADACPCCGGAIHEIGETVSEMLDYVPARLRVLRIRRPKYGCRACGTIHQAPAPERPIAKGLASPGLLAHVLVSKYCDHLPLYRQSQIFARQGVELNRSTLATLRQAQEGRRRLLVAGGAAQAAGGPCLCLKQTVCPFDAACGVAQDRLDTPVPVLDPGRGRTRTGRFWVYARDDRPWAGSDPPAVVFYYSPDRKAERPAAHLKDFRGVLQVDGYAGFERLTEGGDIVLAACWAHARRKFYEFHQATGSPIAGEALRRIAEFYAIEREARGRSAQERQGLRDTRSCPLVDAMKPWLEGQLHRVPPRGALAKAIRYALARWPALCRFLDDGRIELDTNAVERAIRPVALGRKNHLFAGSDGGADRWAIVASLLATAKLNRIEPYAYLKDVLERMTHGHPANRIDDLLPWNWKASNPAT